jgi:transposase
VAIEATSGIVVDRLLAAGHPVVPIHPNSFNAARPRWGASKAKSDPGDSFKLADYLRTDGHRLRAAPVAVDQLDPEVLADCIRIQVRLLRSLLGSLADLDRALAAALGEHPKATVLQPLPRIGQINLAQVLAEVGPILDRASDLSQAAAEVGATRSPSSPARAPWSSSAGQPIPVPATPWASSPTTAATPLRGQPTCTGKPAGAASATPRPSAS